MSDIWDSGFKTSYRFMVVDRQTGMEKRQLSGIVPKSITQNQDSDIFESASIEYVGALDVSPDLLRIYLIVEDPMTGESAEEALGTFLVSTPSQDRDGALSTGTADLYGRLKELYDDDFDTAYVVASGTNAVEAATKIAEDIGLEVIAEESDYKLSQQWVFGINKTNDDSGDNKLDAINQLLDTAGFASAQTDPMGRLVFRTYIEPNDRPSVYTFEEGENARFLRQATDTADVFNVANVVHVDYNTQDIDVRGTAIDESSKYGTKTVGRRIVSTYSYSEVPDGVSTANLQTYANNKAASMLATERSIKHELVFQAVYRPLTVTDAITVEVPTWNISHKYAIRTRELDLTSPACLQKITCRWFER